MDESSSRDSVAIDESVHEVYKQLTEGTDSESVPFLTMKDMFMWAACLGFSQGQRKPLEGRRRVIFHWAQLSVQTDVPLLNALALSEVGVDALRSRDAILTVAEEYANAGIHILRPALLVDHSRPLWNLVDLIEATE